VAEKIGMGRSILIGGGVLWMFAIVATAIVAFIYDGTAERIAKNEKAALLRGLNQLVPRERYDNDILSDYIYVNAPGLEKKDKPILIYRVRRQQEPVAAILQVIASDGYGGPIKMLVAIDADERLAGVRVIAHRETPGLGDGVEIDRSRWILSFDGKSLDNTGEERWRVIKDGGIFDQFTGATITPRAVVKTVHMTLRFFRENKRDLFTMPAFLSDETRIRK